MKLNRVKIATDVVIALVLVLLYTAHGALGLTFHEWAGILIALAFAIHVSLSWDWVVGVTRRLFGRTPGRARLLYLLNVLLLVTMAWTIVSGLFISRVAVPFLDQGGGLWRATHTPVSYLTLIIVGVHLGLNWDWVLTTVRRIAGAPRATPAAAWALRIVALVIFAGGLYSVAATQTLAHLSFAAGGDAGFGQGGPQGRFPGGRPTPGADFTPPGRDGGRPSGEFTPGMARPVDRGGRGPGMGDAGRGGAGGSDLTSALLHAGVIGAFAVPVFYLDKAVTLNRRRRRSDASRGTADGSAPAPATSRDAQGETP